MKSKTVIIEICRIVLAAVFIFSGLTKAIDPWGTSMTIIDYLEFMKLGWLSGTSVWLAVGQSTVELALGLMLLFKVRLRLTALLSMILMAFFTALTLVIAIWNPLDDCGCFGEAVKLDNWQTFFKNLVLLPMSIVVWRSAREGRMWGFSRRDWVLIALFVAVGCGIGAYSWFRLPPVDLFPYKKGTDLRADVLCTGCMERSAKLVYRDKLTGEEHDFALTDTTWYDTARWEYVDTRTPYDNLPEKALEHDFALYSGDRNAASEIIYHEGVTYMILARDPASLGRRCALRLRSYAGRLWSEGARVIYVTGMDGNVATEGTLITADPEVAASEDAARAAFGAYGDSPLDVMGAFPHYRMDLELMSVLLRADAGVVVVDDGVVVGKMSCRGVK